MRMSVAPTASAASGSAWTGSRGRVGIDRKITGIWDGPDEAGSRRDHRRVVGAKRKRRKGGSGKGFAQLRIRRYAPDDGDVFRADLLGGPLCTLDQRADDRALVARREV